MFPEHTEVRGQVMGQVDSAFRKEHEQESDLPEFSNLHPDQTVRETGRDRLVLSTQCSRTCSVQVSTSVSVSSPSTAVSVSSV